MGFRSSSCLELTVNIQAMRVVAGMLIPVSTKPPLTQANHKERFLYLPSLPT